jgi:general secretion pathway protein M
MKAAANTLVQRGQASWSALAARERVLVGSAMAVVLLALLWWVGIQPALNTLRSAEAQHRSLDAQLQTMRALAAQAASLQSQPRISADESQRALDVSVRQRLGATAQLSVIGERATVVLKGASGEALAQWLAAARSNARAVPVEARLAQNPARTGWDGSVVLALPPP